LVNNGSVIPVGIKALENIKYLTVYLSHGEIFATPLQSSLYYVHRFGLSPNVDSLSRIAANRKHTAAVGLMVVGFESCLLLTLGYVSFFLNRQL
jgi:hypothetical protein